MDIKNMARIMGNQEYSKEVNIMKGTWKESDEECACSYEYYQCL